MTLTELLARHPRPHEPAVHDRDRPVTPAMLADESARLAGALHALGVGRGDRVAVWLPNATAWLAAFFACARLGAIAVAVNTRFRTAELADIVARSGLKLLLTWPAFEKADFVATLAGCPPESLKALSGVISYDEGEPQAAQRQAALRAALPASVAVHRYQACLGDAAGAPDLSAPDKGCAIFCCSRRRCAASSASRTRWRCWPRAGRSR